MAREDYEVGEVKFAVDGKTPIHEVHKKLPLSDRKGQIFNKAYSNTAVISPLGTWIVAITDADVADYQYFNRLIVHNMNPTVSCDIRFNGSTTNYNTVTADTTIIFGKTDNKKFSLLVIYNRSAVTEIEIGEMLVEISKVNE